MRRALLSLNRKKVPNGWEKIEPELLELEQQMRDAEKEPNEGKRKPESIWPILRIHHQISRYVYEMFKKREINKELLNYCIDNKIVDGKLIAKWKKPGYEKLCCLLCIQKKNHNFGTTCICRVPKEQLEQGKIIECIHCGCGGCASCDV